MFNCLRWLASTRYVSIITETSIWNKLHLDNWDKPVTKEEEDLFPHEADSSSREADNMEQSAT